MASYTGRVLHIDLTKRQHEVETLDEEFMAKHLGGTGLATRLLYDNMPAGADPLGPDNVMVFATSPCAATLVPTGNKHAVATKSPLTGFLGHCISSSYWSAAMRRAGYDAIVIKGKAASPSYLFVDDNLVHIRPADHLMGKASFETEELIREELADNEVRVSTIGLAGENGVRYACISNDRGRQLGRTGTGAVLGSKNLKAVAIRGTLPVDVADLDGMAELALKLNNKAQGQATAKYRVLGTVQNLLAFNKLGILPTRNFRESVFEAAEQVSGEYMHEHYWEKTVACSGCPIACEQIVSARDGAYGDARVSIDYETLFAFGPCCGIDYFPAIIKAANLCDEYGLDTISTGVTIAWAMEAYERGLLTSQDTGGYDLRFGNHEAMLATIEAIAHRDSLGDLLALGSRNAAVQVGQRSDHFAMHAKGLEMPGYDPRALKTLALGLAVGTRGACHNRSAAYEPDIKGTVDRFKAEPGRGKLAKEQEEYAALFDSLLICKFMRGCFRDFYSEGPELLALTTGFKMSPEAFKQVGERVLNLQKAFNIREGWTRADDWLPPRVFRDPIPNGPSQGAVLSADELNLMLDDYYQVRGWTSEGLIPLEKLADLCLEDLNL